MRGKARDSDPASEAAEAVRCRQAHPAQKTATAREPPRAVRWSAVTDQEVYLMRINLPCSAYTRQEKKTRLVEVGLASGEWAMVSAIPTIIWARGWRHV